MPGSAGFALLPVAWYHPVDTEGDRRGNWLHSNSNRLRAQVLREPAMVPSAGARAANGKAPRASSNGAGVLVPSSQKSCLGEAHLAWMPLVSLLFLSDQNQLLVFWGLESLEFPAGQPQFLSPCPPPWDVTPDTNWVSRMATLDPAPRKASGSLIPSPRYGSREEAWPSSGP